MTDLEAAWAAVKWEGIAEMTGGSIVLEPVVNAPSRYVLMPKGHPVQRLVAVVLAEWEPVGN